ncbi:hypothetical protein [Paenibacillus turpanensis]|nr:hypothetical protein [Paenibacillus turpanensis]
MAMKRKPAPTLGKKKEQVNKKAIIWASSVFGVIVIAVAVLLIING